MLDDNFFIKLEYEIIPNALAAIAHPDTYGFWCDGVTTGEADIFYTKEFANKYKYFLLRAFVGKDGQGEYQLILYLGRKTLSRIARDLSFEGCIPDSPASEWFTIDVQQQKIEIQLL